MYAASGVDGMASSLLHDSTRWANFRALSDGQNPIGCPNNTVNILEINLPKSQALFPGPHAFSEDVNRLNSRTSADIRIILAPLDYPTPENINLLSTLVARFHIPSAFLAERVLGVTNASNFEGDRNGNFSSWLHFLCKAIVHRPDAPTWHRGGYFLSRSVDNGLNLVCFGARRVLVERLQGLPLSAWLDIKHDPLALIAIVLSDIQLTLDEQVWALNASVGNYEHQTIKTSRTKAKFADDFFQDLHWTAKNTVHLKESAEAAAFTCQQFLTLSQSACTPSIGTHLSATTTTLTYIYTLLQSTTLRTSSLQGRIQNAIGLAFNLVAQTDSRCLMAESSSMHSMAVATLIFLPISTVASIFGSQFFQFRAPEPGQESDPDASDFVLSREFWLFWAITVPLTVIVIGAWTVSHPHSIGRWFRRLGCRRRKVGGKADAEYLSSGNNCDSPASMLLRPMNSQYSEMGLTGSSTGSSTLVPGKTFGR